MEFWKLPIMKIHNRRLDFLSGNGRRMLFSKGVSSECAKHSK
jgi:hypothetical protein